MFSVYKLNVRAYKNIRVYYIFRNLLSHLIDRDVISYIVKICQKTVARNKEKKFINLTFFESDILILGES
jgi:hypothetical protein